MKNTETRLRFNSSSSTFEELFNKSLFEKNVLKERIGVDFSDSLKSVDMPKNLFNNFFQSKKAPLVGYFKRQYYQMINDEDYNLLEDYEIKDVYGTEYFKKIYQIVRETSGMNLSHDIRIRRLKKIRRKNEPYNPGVQFYYILNKKDYKIIVIDLYHMIIPAHNSDYPDFPKNPVLNYKNHKSGNYDLSNFIIKN